MNPIISSFLFTSIFLIFPGITFAQDQVFFDLVKNGRWDKVSAYLDTSKSPLNIRNKEGYTPLHWLIKHYVDYNQAKYANDPKAHTKNEQESEASRKTLRVLLEKGANTQLLTPEGWNAVQLAVVCGKWGPTSVLLDDANNKKVKDKDGNTLLHLSVLADNDDIIPKFWSYLHDKVLSDEVNVKTPNYAGQTPIAFYFSKPRKNYKHTHEMVNTLRTIESLTVKDRSGKSAMDYAKENNSSWHFALDLYLERATVVAQQIQEFQARFDAQLQDYDRRRQEYQSASGRQSFGESFSVTYYYQCYPIQGGRVGASPLDENVRVSFDGRKFYISSLEAHYGGLEVESSGYETLGGLRWEMYYFKQSNANFTYKAIGFPVGLNRERCVIFHSTGQTGMCRS